MHGREYLDLLKRLEDLERLYDKLRSDLDKLIRLGNLSLTGTIDLSTYDSILQQLNQQISNLSNRLIHVQNEIDSNMQNLRNNLETSLITAKTEYDTRIQNIESEFANLQTEINKLKTSARLYSSLFLIPYTRLYIGANRPQNPQTLDSFYDTQTNELYVYDGSDWIFIDWQAYITVSPDYVNGRIIIRDNKLYLVESPGSSNPTYRLIYPTVGRVVEYVSLMEDPNQDPSVLYLYPGQTYVSTQTTSRIRFATVYNSTYRLRLQFRGTNTPMVLWSSGLSTAITYRGYFYMFSSSSRSYEYSSGSTTYITPATPGTYNTLDIFLRINEYLEADNYWEFLVLQNSDGNTLITGSGFVKVSRYHFFGDLIQWTSRNPLYPIDKIVVTRIF